MKNKRLIKGALFLLILFFLYFKYSDHLPPSTPLKIARIQSGLVIDRNVKIIEFKEEYSFNGEGYIYVRLKLHENNLHDIIKVMEKEKYKKLTYENLVKDKFIERDSGCGIKLYDKDINLIKDGFYQLNFIKMNKLDFQITVIDLQKKELIVFVNLP